MSPSPSLRSKALFLGPNGRASHSRDSSTAFRTASYTATSPARVAALGAGLRDPGRASDVALWSPGAAAFVAERRVPPWAAGARRPTAALSAAPPNLTASEINVLALKGIMRWNMSTARLLANARPAMTLTPQLARRLAQTAPGSPSPQRRSDAPGVMCPWLPNTTAVRQLRSAGFQVVGIECGAVAVEQASRELQLGPEETGVHDGWTRRKLAPTQPPPPQPPQQQQQQQPDQPVRGQRTQLHATPGPSPLTNVRPRSSSSSSSGDVAGQQALGAVAAGGLGGDGAAAGLSPPAPPAPSQGEREPGLYLYRGNPYNLTPPVLSLVPFPTNAVWDVWGLLVTPPELLPRYGNVWAELLPRGGTWLAAVLCDGVSGQGGHETPTPQVRDAVRQLGLHVYSLPGPLLPTLERAGFEVQLVYQASNGKDKDKDEVEEDGWGGSGWVAAAAGGPAHQDAAEPSLEDEASGAGRLGVTELVMEAVRKGGGSTGSSSSSSSSFSSSSSAVTTSWRPQLAVLAMTRR